MASKFTREKPTVRPRKKSRPRRPPRSGIAPKKAGTLPAAHPPLEAESSGIAPDDAWRWLRFWREIDAAAWAASWRGLVGAWAWAQFWGAVSEAAGGSLI